MSEVIFPCLMMILVGGVGLYFARQNFRTARQSGVIYISRARFERKNGEGWFRAAYWINWIVAAIFAALGIGGIALGAVIFLLWIGKL